MLLRLPYLAMSSVFAFVRLLPMSDVDKEIEILTLRHQLAVLQRQIDSAGADNSSAQISSLGAACTGAWRRQRLNALNDSSLIVERVQFRHPTNAQVGSSQASYLHGWVIGTRSGERVAANHWYANKHSDTLLGGGICGPQR